jgi:hypothetical protein
MREWVAGIVSHDFRHWGTMIDVLEKQGRTIWQSRARVQIPIAVWASMRRFVIKFIDTPVITR